MAVTFTNNKIDGAIVGDSRQAYQSKINPAGVVTTEELAAEVAANLKEKSAFTETIIKEYNSVTRDYLARGYRALLEGLCRLELFAEGTSDTEDEPWNSAKQRIVVRAIPYDEMKYAASDIVPVNTLSPVTIQLLGAQDQTTLEQNTLTVGNTLLCQGKNIQIDTEKEEEGYFLYNDEHSFKANLIATTAGTGDMSFPDAVPGVYTLEVRGRAGFGRNRMLVSSRISNFVVKAA